MPRVFAPSGARRLLKPANSALYLRSRKAETVEAAVTGFGLNPVAMLAGGFLARQSFRTDSDESARFWEHSPRRSVAMANLARHHTNHAVIGALLARNWKLPDEVALAILRHHDQSVFDAGHNVPAVRRLIALGVISDIIIQRYTSRPLGAGPRRPRWKSRP